MLFVRHVNLRPGRSLRTELAHIADHADDFHAVQRIHAAEDHPPDRVLPWKRPLRQRFVDDCRELGIVNIAVVEIPSGSQWNAEGANRPRGDHGEYGLRRAYGELV